MERRFQQAHELFANKLCANLVRDDDWQIWIEGQGSFHIKEAKPKHRQALVVNPPSHSHTGESNIFSWAFPLSISWKKYVLFYWAVNLARARVSCPSIKTDILDKSRGAS